MVVCSSAKSIPNSGFGRGQYFLKTKIPSHRFIMPKSSPDLVTASSMNHGNIFNLSEHYFPSVYDINNNFYQTAF